MKEEVLARLISINRQFYQQFAGEFDATRQRVQPGVARLAAELDPQARILDIGCGNGGFRRALLAEGHLGAYTGLDFSSELLAAARKGAEGDAQATFFQADLAERGWDASLTGPYDVVCAFAAFHHLPPALLTHTLLKVRRMLLPPKGLPGGRLIFSTWQFDNSPRLQERIVPWERLDLTPEELDPEDYLLDWRRGGRGYRYVHLYQEEALEKMAQRCGFAVRRSFYSDGKEGDLALYQTWEPVWSPIELVTLADLEFSQVSDLLGMLLDCFPGGDWPAENPEAQFLAREAARLEAGIEMYRAILWHGSKPVAHAGMFGRDILTKDGNLQVGAVMGVCVADGQRGKGLGTRVMRRLFDQVDRGEFPVALWQTERPDYYEQMGARVISNEWVNSQSREDPGADPWPGEAKMIYPADFDWPQGDLDLNGLPF